MKCPKNKSVEPLSISGQDWIKKVIEVDGVNIASLICNILQLESIEGIQIGFNWKLDSMSTKVHKYM